MPSPSYYWSSKLTAAALCSKCFANYCHPLRRQAGRDPFADLRMRRRQNVESGGRLEHELQWLHTMLGVHSRPCCLVLSMPGHWLCTSIKKKEKSAAHWNKSNAETRKILKKKMKSWAKKLVQTFSSYKSKIIPCWTCSHISVTELPPAHRPHSQESHPFD